MADSVSLVNVVLDLSGSGTVRVQYWSSTGSVLVRCRYWYGAGAVLIRCGCSTDSVRVQY